MIGKILTSCQPHADPHLPKGRLGRAVKGAILWEKLQHLEVIVLIVTGDGESRSQRRHSR